MLALMFTLKIPLKTMLLLLWHRIHLGKIIRAIIAFNAVLILLSVAIDRYISFSVQQNLYENLEDLPYRPYALVLGTSKFVAPGKTNDYYSNRLEAAKSLLEHGKVSYLLLSGDNRTLQYNEPKMMFRDLRKMGVSENLMFRDFAGFRTLDSVIRADKVFNINGFTIVSQKFHCERALFIAEFNDIDAICFVAKQPKINFSTRLREIFARSKAVFDLLLGIKPYFLGEPEPLPMPNNED